MSEREKENVELEVVDQGMIEKRKREVSIEREEVLNGRKSTSSCANFTSGTAKLLLII